MGSVSTKKQTAFQSRSKQHPAKTSNRNRKGGISENPFERSASIVSVTESDVEASPFAITKKSPLKRGGLLEPIEKTSKKKSSSTLKNYVKERNQAKNKQPPRVERNLTVMSINSLSSFNEATRPKQDLPRPNALHQTSKAANDIDFGTGKENRKMSWSTNTSVLSPRQPGADRKQSVRILDRNLTVLSFQTDENVWTPRQ